MEHPNFTRRHLLTGVATVLVASALLPYTALSFAEKNNAIANANEFSQFHHLSKLLTATPTLDSGLAAKYFAALQSLYPQFPQQIAQLHAKLPSNATAQQVQAIAKTEHMETLIQTMVAAWYTGTVGPNGDKKTHMVAYYDALLYAPNQDGLVVPTYCRNGPLWWTALPPDISQEPSIPVRF